MSLPLDLHSISPAALDDEPWPVSEQMFAILCKLLQPNSTITALIAAQLLNELYPSHRIQGEPKEGEVKESPEVFLWEMWSVLFRVAAHIPPQNPIEQDRLAEMVKELHDLPEVETIPVWGSESRLWPDLPLFGPFAEEEMDRLAVTSPTADPNQIHERACWRNLHAFCARLTRDGTCHFVRYALWALRPALEDEPDSRAKAYQTQGPALDYYIPIAADWISQTGSVLFGCEEDSSSGDQGGRLWKGKPGFSVERWAFWKKRFGEVAVFEQCGEETRKVARETAVLMGKIESETGGK